MNKKNVLIINVENLEKATTLQDSDLNDPLVTSHLENTFPFGSMFFLAWLLPRCYTMSINKKMIMIINFDFLTTKLSSNNENRCLVISLENHRFKTKQENLRITYYSEIKTRTVDNFTLWSSRCW
jgi:hypothetical protein